ncbi:MAG: tryptophan--tRNA ligase [Planctomycetota bacterium]|jgi:tryptophanyl-tRNA synthetase
MRILSGIQPSGILHLGAYFGAMREHVRLAAEHEAYYFIADYHALTSVQDAETLRGYRFGVAADYLAIGLDPETTTLFSQVDVPEVTELAWILSTLTPMPMMENAHAYKDKTARGLPASLGLVAYPALMAADILIYDSDAVPVGADQKQHVEITRDLAGKFNRTYGETLRLPQEIIKKDVAVVPGIDGAKMSKSYGNGIAIFLEGKPLKKRIMSIVTDSKGVEEPKDPDTCNAFALWKLFAGADDIAEMRTRYAKGGLGYGEVKSDLLRRMEEHFADARVRRRELEANPDRVWDILTAGGKKARATAQGVMARVRDACGLTT